MHRRGINMRYLGMIANIIDESHDKKLDHVKVGHCNFFYSYELQKWTYLFVLASCHT